MTSAGNEKDNKDATESGEGQGPDEETVLRRMLNMPPKPRKGSTKKDNHEPKSPDRDF